MQSAMETGGVIKVEGSTDPSDPWKRLSDSTLVGRSVFASLAFNVRVRVLFTSFHVDSIQ